MLTLSRIYTGFFLQYGHTHALSFHTKNRPVKIKMFYLPTSFISLFRWSLSSPVSPFWGETRFCHFLLRLEEQPVFHQWFFLKKSREQEKNRFRNPSQSSCPKKGIPKNNRKKKNALHPISLKNSRKYFFRTVFSSLTSVMPPPVLEQRVPGREPRLSYASGCNRPSGRARRTRWRVVRVVVVSPSRRRGMAKVMVVVGRGPAAVDAGVKAWNFQMEKQSFSVLIALQKLFLTRYGSCRV